MIKTPTLIRCGELALNYQNRSIYMTYFLVTISSILIAYIIYLHFLLKKITNKLKQINSTETNAVIDLTSKNPYFIQLALEISRLIQLNKINHQHLIESQNQFDMAINNISHDIRTPLTVASGYTQLLKKKINSEQTVLVNKISNNLINVEKKLDDLLTYNRLLEHRVSVNLTKLNLSSLLENKTISFYEAFQKEKIELNLEIEKNISLITDQELVNRIIENALGNILNHGVNKASIKLRKEKDKITLLFSNQTNQVILSYDKLFNRFYTEDLARVKKNSGLGLYIIKELVDLLKGDVTATGDDDIFSLIITLHTNKKD